MTFLHPFFNFVLIFLLIASFLEVFIIKKKLAIVPIITAIILIFMAGFRNLVGADFGSYKGIFLYLGLNVEYSTILEKAFLKGNELELEWIYSLINKLVFDQGMPFFMLTFFIALISISLKSYVIFKNIAYPSLGLLFYFIPLFFFEDSGQIRQGLGIGICVFSFTYIKSRNLPMFLLCIYLGLGFHKTSIVFLPAYWIATIPMTTNRIITFLVISVLLSPFEIFKLFTGMIESISPPDISRGYTDYLNDDANEMGVETGISDVVKTLIAFLVIKYDKISCEKVPYYEYMRNLGVFGLGLYYIMRGNAIFAIRMPGVYLFFLHVFVLPSIIYAVQDGVKRIIHTGIVSYIILLYFNFSKGSGKGGNFTSDKYQNIFLNKSE